MFADLISRGSMEDTLRECGSLYVMVCDMSPSPSPSPSPTLSNYDYDHRRHPLSLPLSTEFEIPERFKAVDFKVDLIQNNTKFFMEVLHNQKSDKLEWAIIILLLFEIMLCLYDIFERYSLRQIKMAVTGEQYVDSDDEDD